jgi:hypothetical protein
MNNGFADLIVKYFYFLNPGLDIMIAFDDGIVAVGQRHVHD